jgi:hypothetical protein
MADRLVLHTGAGQRLRIRRFRVSGQLPRHDGEPVDDEGEEMVCERPADRFAVDGQRRSRIGRQGRDEAGDPAGGEAAPAKIGQVCVVVAEQVGLDRVAVVG